MRLVVVVLLLMALCYQSTTSHGLAVGRKGARPVPARPVRLAKRQDDLGYLEQCSILRFWDRQIGRVNVLAFFDSSWQFSHRQASMLKVLRERLERTGFSNIQFFAVNAAPGSQDPVEDRADLEAEEETWRQISPSEAGGEPPVDPSPEALVEALGSHIYFIQDDDHLQIWPKLRALRDQILVVDRCGRLTYQVIVPWSILHFPYVKAAILSTYKDEPCGYCQYQDSPFDATSTENDFSSTLNESPTATASSESNDTTSPRYKESTIRSADYDSTTEVLQSEESTTQSTDYDGTSLQPEESSAQTVDYNSMPTTTSTESLTIAEQSDDGASTSNWSESSTSFPDTERDGNAPTTTQQPASWTFRNEEDDEIPASTTDAFDPVSTTVYDPALLDLSQDNVTSLFLGEDADENYNDTTPPTGLMSTTEDDRSSGSQVTEKLSELTDVTERQISETDFSTTSEDVNTSSPANESRLKETEEIENLDARDVLKSRSTNARSVSPNDGTENHLEAFETKSKSSDAAKSGSTTSKPAPEQPLPIRIIMRAPHVDEYSDRTMKAHEYLVLKTGEPDYHEHLEEPPPSGERLQHRPATISRTFGKDESPGLYGEVADYWRNFGNEQLNGSTQTGADHQDGGDDDDEVDEQEHQEQEEQQQILEQDTGFIVQEHTVTPTAVSMGYMEGLDENAEEIEFDSEKNYDNSPDFNDDVDAVDEEAKSKLIAHYSKLLPWLYYVLAK